MKTGRKWILLLALVLSFCWGGQRVDAAASISAPVVSASNSASSGKVKLTWAAIDGAVSYKVYRATGKTGTYSLMKTVTGTSYTNTSATAGKTYYYYVRAVGENGETSPKSNIVTRTCDLPRPKVTATNVASSGKVKLTWSAIDGAVSYKVYRATGKTGTYSLMKTVTGTSYTNTSATAGKTYYYKVKAICEKTAANSAMSSVVSRTCDLARPTVTVSNVESTGKVRLTWKSVSGAVSYKVYRATGKTGTYSLMKTVTGTSYTNTSATVGKTYYYKVRAVCEKSAGNSAYSLIKSGKAVAVSQFRTAYVLLPSVYVYQEASSDSARTILPYMAEVQIGDNVTSSENGTWTRIKYEDELYYCWIPAGTEKFTEQKSDYAYVNSGNTDLQNAVIRLALKYDGLPTYYAHGQSTGEPDPETGKYGFDCSGFVAYVINTVMAEENPLYKLTKDITKLHTNGTGDNENGVLYNEGYNNSYTMQKISRKNLQPGDVIFFKLDETDSKSIDHCGIYLGNNEFIHATTSFDGLCIMPLTEFYDEGYVTAYRYYPEQIQAAEQTVVTNVTYARIYSERSSASERLYQFALGEELTLLFTSSNGNWAYVRNRDGLEGFVLLKYLDLA